ncbi:hypothetical protein AVT43_gp58 [Polaribacter phage P12002L]|uniref:Uncharacterized protein n=2 Tax=Incheonvirus TaxID=2976977 RepID=A0A0F7DD31_9CAUD|nr:hypothetical protein AVT42_gp60 [Polaribacter phage P12002S]YP_009209718.1 hypothetical protein AVT43_gp58 [Polaribacter phage P12002L]AKG94232.1 hypothetical protein P12002L_0058 [Polaribacter phage P12002L]AKG94316.1 hypothetical protein P12002S_0060 [Polaribacter phage P12002S]
MQEDFKEYLKEARQRFCNETQKYNVKDNLRLRTEVDSFLIAYDQAVSKAFSLNAVSQHRELLIAYEKNHYTPQEWALASKQCIEDIDNFLAINCG